MVESCHPVTVRDIPQPPPGSCVDKVGIYRLESTWDTEKGFKDANTANIVHSGYFDTDTEADWFLVGEAPVGKTQFIDTFPADKLGRTLTTFGFFPPEEGLHVAGLNSSGQLVGFKDNVLWLSEKNAGHAWPGKNRLALDDNIKRVIVNEDTIFVLTDGCAYVISRTAECQDVECLNVKKATRCLPICNPDSAVFYDGKLYYASQFGLARLSSSGDVVMESEWAFSQDDWQQLDPSTMQGVIYNGQYFYTSSQGAGYFDMSGTQQSKGLVRLSVHPQQWITDQAGDLFLLHDGMVYKWDAGPEKMEYTWEARLDVQNSRTRMTAMKVVHCEACDPSDRVADGSLVSLCRDGRDAVTRRIAHSDPFRVPPGRGINHHVRVISDKCIREIHYAQTVGLLTRGINFDEGNINRS